MPSKVVIWLLCFCVFFNVLKQTQKQNNIFFNT